MERERTTAGRRWFIDFPSNDHQPNQVSRSKMQRDKLSNQPTLLMSFWRHKWTFSLTKQSLPASSAASLELTFGLWPLRCSRDAIAVEAEMQRILALFCFPLLRERQRQTDWVTDKRTNRRAGQRGEGGGRERERCSARSCSPDLS